MAPARDDSLSPSRSPTPVPVPEHLSRSASRDRSRSPRGAGYSRRDDRERDNSYYDGRYRGADREYERSRNSGRDRHKKRHDDRPHIDPRSHHDPRHRKPQKEAYSHRESGRHRDGHGDSKGYRDEDYHPRHATTEDDKYKDYRRKRQESRDSQVAAAHGEDVFFKRTGARVSHSRPTSRNGDEYDSHDGGRGHIQSVRTKDHPSPEPSYARREAKSLSSITQQTTPGTKSDPYDLDQKGNQPKSTKPEYKALLDGRPASAIKEVSIEERRRRREAIKARVASQSTPNAVHAGEATSIPELATPSGPATPAAPSERSASFSDASATSPKTPIVHDESPESLERVQISKEMHSGNTTAPSTPGYDSADEPSAADYDPTADMQEDRMRHGMPNIGNGVSATTYDETKEDAKQIVPPTTDAMQIGQVEGAGDTDDDMDMFAEERPSETLKAVANSKKKTPLPTVQPGDHAANDQPEGAENIKDGYYDPLPNDVIQMRYKVQKTLGKGTFASVIRCEDLTENKLVAVKVIKNNDYMKELGRGEIKHLKRINDADPDDKRCIVRFLDQFIHKQHLCLVFENLSLNLRELIKKHGRHYGLHYSAVRRYSRQMFIALDHLQKCDTVHADLKPDNILVDEETSKLKICDLGSAAETWQLEVAPYLASRFYRAPEIMLGVPYSFPIDVWSIGCTLFELYTAKILFTGANNNEMLRHMQEARGRFNNNMIKKAECWGQYFTEDFLFRSSERDKLTGTMREKLVNYKQPVPGKDLKSRMSKSMHPQADETEKAAVGLLVDLLEKCLQTNPEKRITPKEALQHPFVAHSLATGQQQQVQAKGPVMAANKMFLPRAVLNAKKKGVR